MKLFVGNLNFKTTDEDLKYYFEDFGEVSEAIIVFDRETGRPRGFGFVTMPNDDEAQEAIDATDGVEFQGRSLNVNEAREKKGYGNSRR